MDPTNSSIPTPNPVPGPTPVPDPKPVPPAPAGAPVPPAPSTDVNAPVPPTPDMSPAEMSAITPSGPAGGEPVVPGAGQMGGASEVATEPLAENTAVGNDFATPASDAPVPPVARPTNIDGINSVPTAELGNVPQADTGNAPAGPTPTSGGQSIDGILGNNPFAAPANTPSVSFTDPATQPETGNNMEATQPTAVAPKKKSSKAVLIALSVIAFIVAAVLGVVLVMMLTESGPFSTNNSNNSGNGSSAESGNDENNGNSGNGNNNGNGGNTAGDDENGGNGGSGGAVVNPGEDTIVCTMSQEDTNADGTTQTSTVTMTLYFTNNNFARASIRGETIDSNSTVPTVTTMDMTAAEMLEMGGIDWSEAGVTPNEDGSVAATKDQVMDAIGSSYSEMTCISPSSM